MTSKEYKTITDIKGPLVFLKRPNPLPTVRLLALGSVTALKRTDSLDTSDDMVVVQVFEGTEAIDRKAGEIPRDVFKLQ